MKLSSPFVLIGVVVIGTFLSAGDATAADHERCLATALYWEAKTEEDKGMTAVASVIVNRVGHDEFPDSICAVVKQGGEEPPCQFSFWCDGKSDAPEIGSDGWERAKEIAGDTLQKIPVDVTKGALFFHAEGLETPWILQREKTVEIGGHIFYR